MTTIKKLLTVGSLLMLTAAGGDQGCGCESPSNPDPAVKLLEVTSDNSLGQVTSDVGGIDCGTLCTVTVDSGATVTLTATPLAGTNSTFVGWGDDCSGTQPTCTLTVDASKKVTANWMANYPDMAVPPDMIALSAPTVTSVSPASIVNNVATPLTITGKNFRAGATVTVGGVACTQATVVSPTQITCTYPGKAATCGGQGITVTHPDDMKSGSLAAAQGLSLRSAGIGFGAPAPLPAGTNPDHVVAGDFDGDGKLDLANTNRGGSIQLRLGNGDGTFQAPKDLASGLSKPIGLIAVDLNGDGKQDLVSANLYGDNISVLLNSGGGAFAAPVSSSVPGGPVDLVTGDFNGDGKADLAIALNVGSQGAIRLGDGNGGFLSPSPANLTAGGTAQNVAVGDVNGDKIADVAITGYGANAVFLSTGKGDGTFNAATMVSVVNQPVGAMFTDVNKDGMLDLLVGGQGGTSVGLYLGNGNGTFAAGTNLTTGSSPRFTLLADIDGDGITDFVSANADSNNVSLRLGNGTTFTGNATQDYAVDMGPFTVAAGDFNRDGTVDLVTANFNSNNLSVLLRQCK